MSEKEIARIKKLFGANLKKIRESKSLSLLEADYGSELNESNISKYENGKREPQLSTIIKLAKMLKIHPKELLDFGVDFTPENPNKESAAEGSNEA
jgi:transcriptional regulator with XRE-family HTH domain